MPNKGNAQKNWWKKVRDFFKTHSNLTVILAAALLLELTTGVLYYNAQNIIHEMMGRLVRQEMKGIAMNIRKQLSKAEVVINNYTWVVTGDIEEPAWMFESTRRLVEHNPFLHGCGVAFVPNYYPEKGYWFEPYAGRRPDGSVESMQLGSQKHDYTKLEAYTYTVEHDSDHWSEPYYDPDGAQSVVMTYSSPAHDDKGNIVAVVAADISLEWINDIMDTPNSYKSIRRFLVSREYKLISGDDDPVYHQALALVRSDDSLTGYLTLTEGKHRKQHVFYYPVGGITGWTLICVCSDSEIFAPLRKTHLALLLLSLAGLMLMGFIVWRTTRNLERLRKTNAEKDRIGGELHAASQIQQSMLPASHMQRDDVAIEGFLAPAREVGGDLYDYFVRDEKLFFCIGDVSGKGAPAAMLMAVTQALFRSASAHESNPARIMHTINQTTCQGNEANMFVTFFIGVLDLPTGHLRYCNAGHDAPFLLLAGTKPATIDCAANLPVGLFEEIRYNVQETHLAGGSTMFLYTDGLTEAMNNAHKLFGMKRVEAVLAACSDLTPKAVLTKAEQSMHTFVGDAEQSDDLTMLAIRYTPTQFDSIMTETIVLKNNVHEVTRFSDFIKSATERMGIGKSTAQEIRLAIEEAVVNVINYAYPIGTEGSIEVGVMFDGKSLKATIVDSGVPFDPTAKEKADTTLAAEERQIGGLGILLVRELMDSINYEYTDGKNILTLVKTVNR